MASFSPRVPHLFPRRTLATLLTSTYAEAASVDDEEAHARLTQALGAGALVDALHDGISRALEAKRGPRTTPDKLLDSVSAGIARRKGNLRPAPSTADLAAVLVRINLEIGLAPEPMRATLSAGPGAAALERGFAALGSHLVKELLR
jgi:hypothetical protein